MSASPSSSAAADSSGLLWIDHATDRFTGTRMAGAVLAGVHPATACAGRSCCIHAPSEHPLAEAPLCWRADRRIMERLCIHGVGHPDPDDAAYRATVLGGADTVHGCDGCC